LRDANTKAVDAAKAAQVAHEKLTKAQVDAKTAAGNQGKTMDELSAKLQGQASAAADTFTGKLKGITTHLEDQAAAFGQKYGPALTAAGAGMTALGAAVEVTGAATKAFTAVEWAEVVPEMATLAPILLIIGALAVLGAAAFLIWKNWGTIWNAMKAVVVTVWNWIKANWPLLLAIILGPIAIAAVEIAKHWNAIKAGAQAVFSWLAGAWQAVAGFITRPIAAGIADAKALFDGLVSFVAGIPGAIGSRLGGAFEGLWDSFRNVVNRIIGGWNSLHFSIPSVDTHIPGVGKVGGESFGVPQIPMLAAGGLMTSSGLVFAHAGEVISPAPPNATRSGPAVNIEQATFSTELDIEAFMRKAAWIAKTNGM
jgi:hypothetical protein